MTNESTLLVKTRRRGEGWTFELFHGDPPVWREGDVRTFTTQQEAEQAGHEAVQVTIRRMMGRPHRSKPDD